VDLPELLGHPGLQVQVDLLGRRDLPDRLVNLVQVDLRDLLGHPGRQGQVERQVYYY
jgi:hypothetical protein